MTLQIKVLKMTGKQPKGQLLLEAKTTGTFIIRSFYPEDDPRRTVYFSLEDCIEISLYDEHQVPNASNRKAFINQPCEQMIQFLKRSPNYEEDKWLKYDIQLYNERDQPYATVHLQIKYNKGLLLQGIMPTGIQRQLKNFSFFKGSYNGKTLNMFNFLDLCCAPDTSHMEFKMLEDIQEDSFY